MVTLLFSESTLAVELGFINEDVQVSVNNVAELTDQSTHCMFEQISFHKVSV